MKITFNTVFFLLCGIFLLTENSLAESNNLGTPSNLCLSRCDMMTTACNNNCNTTRIGNQTPSQCKERCANITDYCHSACKEHAQDCEKEYNDCIASDTNDSKDNNQSNNKAAKKQCLSQYNQCNGIEKK
jgi:hypothetical protein